MNHWDDMIGDAEDLLPIIAARIDLQERWLRVPKRLASLLGRRPQDMTGRPITEVFFPEDIDDLNRARDAVLSGPGRWVDREHRLMRADGSSVWFECRAWLVRDDAGNPLWVIKCLQDISARRAVEQALIETERKHSTLVAHLQGMVYRCRNDQDWTVEFASEGTRLVTGYEPAELLNKQVSYGADVIHPYDRVRVWTEVQAALAQRQSFKLSYRIIAKDGERRWVWEQGAGVFDDAGRLVAIEGVISDVTSLHATQEKLRETQVRLQAAVEHLPSELWMCDEHGRYVLQNSVARSRRGEQVGKTPSELLNPDRELRRRWSTENHRVLKGEVIDVSIEEAVDGELRSYHKLVAPIRDHDRIIGLVGLMIDETDRLRTARVLTDTESRFRQLAENTDDVFWFMDLNPLRVLYVNPAFQRIWGLPASELLEDPSLWIRIIHPADRERARAEFNRWIHSETSDTLDMEYRIVRPDGHVRWIHDRGSQIHDHAGRVYRVAGIAEDISERKLAEQRTSLMMQELDHRVKNNLAAVLSLADETARHSSTLDEFKPAFLGRIAALARQHSLLAQTRWTGMQIHDLVRVTLEPYVAGSPRRLRIDGPAFMLPARAGTPMCMALHELATNAAKYGALSQPAGSIRILWTIQPKPGGDQAFRLRWEELGGPPVSTPERRGVGTGLIVGAIAYQLDGAVDLSFEPRGVVCDIRFELKDDE